MTKSKRSVAGDALADTINRRALEIIDLLPVDREARYSWLQEIHHSTGVTIGMTEQSACELAMRLDEWLRDVVRVIEASGGGRCGVA